MLCPTTNIMERRRLVSEAFFTNITKVTPLNCDLRFECAILYCKRPAFGRARRKNND